MNTTKLVNRFSIKLKLILAFLSVSIVSVLLLGLCSHHYYSRAVEDNFSDYSHEAANRLNYFLDYYFNEFQRSTSSMIESSTIQKWLTSKKHTNSDIKNVEEVLRRYGVLNYSEIQNVFLVDRKHEVVSMDQSFGGKQNYSLEPWYRETLQNKKTIIRTHLGHYPKSRGESVISIILPIYSVETTRLIGNLIIDISLSEIHQAFSQSKLGETGFFFIVSDNQKIVYHPNDKWDGLPISKTDLKSLDLVGKHSVSIQSFKGEDYLVASVTSNSTKWKIISLVPYSQMAGELQSATKSMMIILGIIFIFILLVVPFLVARLTRPILILKNLMHKVAKGDLSVRSKYIPGSDEFQQLNHSFNIMVDRLEELFHTNIDLKLKEVQSKLLQKEAMIKALQNQINPHLLYNSLGLIQSIAYLKEIPMIEKIARNLADVYRYTARFNEKETTLKTEIEHLQKYLEIIYIRFPDDFQSFLFVSEKYMHCSVLKLILQPIVENAVKYSIEPLEGKGVIIINAFDEKEELIIEIADNGHGIEKSKVEEITYKLEKISANEISVYEESESLGILNVHARLVLKYGPKYGVAINSFVNRGTVISLRLPLIKS